MDRRTAGSGPLADYQIGMKVDTREGYTGVITDILEAPSDLTTYWVTLDNDMGGGEYAEGEIWPVPNQSTAQLASVEHTAMDDYPELGTALSDRLPPVIISTGAKKDPEDPTSLATRLALYLPLVPGASPKTDRVPPEQEQGYTEGFEHGKEGITRQPSLPADADYMAGYDLGWGEGVLVTRQPPNSWDQDELADAQTGGTVPDPLTPNYPMFSMLDRLNEMQAHGAPVIQTEAGIWDMLSAPNKSWKSTTDHYSYDWCRFRRDSHCWLPKTLDADASKQAGYAVWTPFDRGFCPRIKWEDQIKCPAGQPGPKSGAGGFTDATVSWEAGGQRNGTPSGLYSHMGSLTAKDYEGEVGNRDHITRSEVGTVPTSSVAHLLGVKGEQPGEHRNRQGQAWEDFLSDIKANGIKDPLFITVDHGEAPKISEGNHRRDAAVALGLPEVPVEIRYFGHAEQGSKVASLKVESSMWVDGPAEPEYDKDFPGSRIYGGREAAVWYSHGCEIDPGGVTIHAVQVEPYAQRQGKATALLDWIAKKYAGHALDPGGLTDEGRPLWAKWTRERDWPRPKIRGPHNDYVILTPRSQLNEQQRSVTSGLQVEAAPKRYLRVGTWRDSEESWNFATGDFEKGISVYNLDDSGQPVVPPEGEWAESDLSDRLASDDPKFIVTGREVGTGGDGEPLLKDVRILSHWQGHEASLHTAAFEVHATWADVRRKAKRIRQNGGVRIVAAKNGEVVAHVQGDHGIYESHVRRNPGRSNVAYWHCGCKWGAYAWGRSPAYKRFEGRMCSHVLAVHYEAQSRNMFGREMTLDEKQPAWMDQKHVHLPGDYRRDLKRYTSLEDTSISMIAADPAYDPDSDTPKHAAREVSIMGKIWGAIKHVVIGDSGPKVEGRDPVEAHQVLYPGWDPTLGLSLSDGGRHIYAKTASGTTSAKTMTWEQVKAKYPVYASYGMNSAVDEVALGGPTWDGQHEDYSFVEKPVSLHGVRFQRYPSSDSRVQAALEGGQVPPVLLVERAGEKIAVDGHHRLSADEISGKDTVTAVVAQSPREDKYRGGALIGTVAAKKSDSPEVSGVVLKAADTGRILMLQRDMGDKKDPAAGTWEFPGGHHEDGDQTSLHAGIREWEEEVGQTFPEGGYVAHTWTSPNGVYQGHVVVIPEEKSVVLHDGRVVENPDDPDSKACEQVAWWTVEHAKKNPALREECKASPWKEFERAGNPSKVAADLTAALLSTAAEYSCTACSGTGEQGTGHECYICDGSGQYDPTAEDRLPDANANPENGLLVGRDDAIGQKPVLFSDLPEVSYDHPRYPSFAPAHD